MDAQAPRYLYTFGRVLAALDPAAFEWCMVQWTAALAKATGGCVLAIDGKTLRRGFQSAGGKAAIHMVNAWRSANHMVLGQLTTEEKSNEITAIPKLLELLDLKGAIVTLDAMGCQKAIAQEIIKGGGDYLIAVKGNQGKLQEQTRRSCWASRGWSTIGSRRPTAIMAVSRCGVAGVRRMSAGPLAASNGPGCGAWRWSNPRGRCWAGPRAPSVGTTSPACRAMTRRRCWRRPAATGVWRTASTGAWMWLTGRTSAASAPAMRRKTSRGCGD